MTKIETLEKVVASILSKNNNELVSTTVHNFKWILKETWEIAQEDLINNSDTIPIGSKTKFNII